MISRASLLRQAEGLRLRGQELLTFRRAPRQPVLAPYDDRRNWRSRLQAAGLLIGLALFCVIYGFFFALTAPYLAVACLLPILVAACLAVWALPEQRTAPVRALEVLFIAYVLGLLLWPRYLALALPGLPWISMQRLTGMPLALILLVSVSTSKTFRSELWDSLKAVPFLWPAFLVYIAAQIYTLPFSHAVGTTLQRVISNQTDWTCIFLTACVLCRPPGRAWKYVTVMLATAAINVVLAAWESRLQALPWAGIVPSFLQVQDADLYLQAWARGIGGLYRAKSVFSTPLGLAEYLALLTPFFLHFVVWGFRPHLRAMGAVMFAACAYAINLSHSRVGVAGMFVSTVAYVLLWGLVRWRNSKSDIIGPSVVIGYPALAAIAGLLALTVPALRIRLLGGGGEASSTAARFHQINMAMPAVLSNPIGHGSGQSGAAMGYAPGQFITIDSYYIDVLLDLGVIGLAAFVTIFASAILAGFRTTMTRDLDPTSEEGLILPITVALAAFLVMKLVFGQPDNHWIVFAFMGMLSALLARQKPGQKPA